jgi:predicted transcriptional regulator
VPSRKAPVSDGELEVLKVLWSRGPGTVRDVAEALRDRARSLAYNTVLTLLARLRDKGYVATDKSSTAHVFRPLVSREDLLNQGLAKLADRICDGTSGPLVHALVKHKRLSAKEIAELRKLLDELERGKR